MHVINPRYLFPLSLLLTTCTPQPPDAPPPTVAPAAPQIDTRSLLSEDWIAHPELLHFVDGGLSFDVADADGAKYLELNGAWLPPETISPETAERDNLPWAAERSVAWLAGTTATFRFPLKPPDGTDDLTLHLQLRPKVNATADVRFYKFNQPKADDAWTEPKTVQLRPGWHDNAVTIPRSWLNESGAQLMRITFPGTFFEGDSRVSAKFVRVALVFSASGAPSKPRPIAPGQDHVTQCRIDDRPRDAFELSDGASLTRYLVVPYGQTQLTFDAAPSPWMADTASLRVTIDTDAPLRPDPLSPDEDSDDEPATPTRAVPLDLRLNTGSPWSAQTIDLSPYAGQAVRITLQADMTGASVFPRAGLPAPTLCIADARIQSLVPDSRMRSLDALRSPDRVVVIAVDNLRPDRISGESAPALAALADRSFHGTALAEAPGGIASTVSFLTGTHLPQHGVNDDTTHVRSSLTTIAEALPEWTSHFYTTTSVIDPARGFAQGFTDVRRLNREKLAAPKDTLALLTRELDTAPHHSLFYLHLGTLRLPLSPSHDALARFATPGYSGPVTPQAMLNPAVLRNPTPADARQFAAYYDAALSELDAALADFLQSLPDDTLLLLFGTHSSSLGESTLGYMQTLAPYEVHVPWLLYSKQLQSGQAFPELIPVTALRATLLDLLGLEDQHDSITHTNAFRPVARWNGFTAASTQRLFYKIRREGIESTANIGTDDSPLQTTERPFSPITQQAFREWMQ